MKITLLVILIFCTAAAFGQSAPTISNQVSVAEFSEHPEHASYTPMACEHPLVGANPDTYEYAKGERPLWEFGPVSEPVPLGDVARAYREGKVASRKATVVLEKQGS